MEVAFPLELSASDREHLGLLRSILTAASVAESDNGTIDDLERDAVAICLLAARYDGVIRDLTHALWHRIHLQLRHLLQRLLLLSSLKIHGLALADSRVIQNGDLVPETAPLLGARLVELLLNLYKL